MINIENKKECSGCSACYNICPVDAIKMVSDKEGFLYPVADADKCVNCGICDKICPCINNLAERNTLQKVYAAVSKDDKTRLKSSSGGVFYLLSEYVIRQGGVIYGASFDEEFHVVHDSAENIKDIYRLMGSKYVQSNIGETYKNVLRDLKDDRMVMFTGTSCQVAGLKAFLKTDYKKLITVDLICKSIPSPKIWDEYIKYFYKNKKIKKINFKDKSRGWDKFSVNIDTEGKNYNIKGRNDFYMQGFFKSLYNRPACMDCKFRYPQRVSDITLADCWGIDKMAPELNDNLGASTVMINSDKGSVLLFNIEESLRIKEIDIHDVLQYNPYLGKCEGEKKARKVFWYLHGRVPFKVLLKMMAFPYKEKTVDTMRNIYHKLRRKK